MCSSDLEEPEMATMVAVMVFAASMTAAMWTIYATVRPELARIGDLLRHGPVTSVPALPVATARIAARDAMARAARTPARLRAAA